MKESRGRTTALKYNSIYAELEDSFFAEMRFVELLRFFGSGVRSRPEGETEYAILLQISTDYRTLRPSDWLDTVTAVISDTATDEWLRALALELKGVR